MSDVSADVTENESSSTAPLPTTHTWKLMVVSAVLLASALLKLAELATEQHTHPKGSSAILQHPALRLIIITLECCVAVLLALSRRRQSVYLAFALCSAFLVLVIAMLWRGLDVTACGCFGDVELPTRTHIALLGGMMLLLVSTLRET